MKYVSKFLIAVGAVLALVVAGGVDAGRLSVEATAIGSLAAIAFMLGGTAWLTHAKEEYSAAAEI